MQLEEVLRRRRMTRRFEATPLRPETLGRLLDAARRVPSAGFTQAVEVVVLTQHAARQRFWAAVADPGWVEEREGAGIVSAPVVVVPVVSPAAYRDRYQERDKTTSSLAGAEGWGIPYWLVDASFCVLALLLAAENEHLGALFFHLQGREAAALAALGVPPAYQTIGAVALGTRAPDEQPSGSPTRRARRGLDELVHREGW